MKRIGIIICGRYQDCGGGGPGGYCACPSCGARVPHQRGLPCNQRSCPKCGIKMTR